MVFLKRIFLLIVTNLAILIVLSIFFSIITSVFWISLWEGKQMNMFVLLVYAFIFGFLASFISLLLSRWIAKKMYGIVLIDPEKLYTYSPKERKLYEIVARLSEKHGIAVPEVGIYESEDPNAFATGFSKNSSLVAVSTALLENLSDEALEGVIGHEMAHIINGDMVTMTLIQWVMNVFVIFISHVLANIISNIISKFFQEEEEGGFFYSLIYYIVVTILELIFGILASLIVLAFSRYREYRADADSAFMVGKQKMIAWLESLKLLLERDTIETKDAFATMKISGKTLSWILEIFSTHPDLDKRIERLKSL